MTITEQETAAARRGQTRDNMENFLNRTWLPVSVRIQCDAENNNYTVTGTFHSQDEGTEHVLVADRLTFDEMLGAVVTATMPKRSKECLMLFATKMPQIAAQALKETGKL